MTINELKLIAAMRNAIAWMKEDTKNGDSITAKNIVKMMENSIKLAGGA